MRFIAPRTDFAFKKIFGSPEGLEPLRSFIEAVMDLHGSERLAELQLVDPYQPGQVSVLKRSYLDVKCSDLNGRKFLIEMQVEPVKEFAKRVVYNAAKAYVGQLERGESYLSLTQVVAISICDFVMFPEFEHYLSEHMVRETLSSKSYLDEVRYYFLELPKFEKDEAALTTAIDKWAFFLRSARSLEQVPKRSATSPLPRPCTSQTGPGSAQRNGRSTTGPWSICRTSGGKLTSRSRKGLPWVGPKARPSARPRPRAGPNPYSRCSRPAGLFSTSWLGNACSTPQKSKRSSNG